MGLALVAAVYESHVASSKFRHFDSDDIRQEAALDAWLYSAEAANVKSVARTIVRHTFLTALTRERWPKRGGGRVAQLPVAKSGDVYEPSEEMDPLAEVCEAEANAEIRAVVASLPDAQARAISLRFFEDLTYQEVADRMGISLTAAGGLLKRGLKALKERLSHE